MTGMTRLRRALDSIEAVFSDTSVPPEATIEALEEIQADVEAKLDALRSDLSKGDR